MAIKYLSKSSRKNKTALVRSSLDANVDEQTGKVSDDFRLRNAALTLNWLKKHNNRAVVCGKMKRPKGKKQSAFSLRPQAKKLAEILRLKFVETSLEVPQFGIPHLVFFTGDFREKHCKAELLKVKSDDVVVLENLEFYPEELSNGKNFAKSLAALADVYIDDDFSKAHHEVASNSAITEYLPSYAGLVLENEIKCLSHALKNPKRPLVLMTGGIKLKEKVGVLENLGHMADKILVGGGVASLMFREKGFEVGLSKFEEGEDKEAHQVLRNFKEKLVLPADVVVSDASCDPRSARVCKPFEVGKKEYILDAGPKTILEFAKYLKTANTIVWSGPLGMFEQKPFHHATFALARLLGGRGKGKAFVIAGGGDTVDALRHSHQLSHIDHVSTGGGAMLEFLAGKKLPGIEALK